MKQWEHSEDVRSSNKSMNTKLCSHAHISYLLYLLIFSSLCFVSWNKTSVPGQSYTTQIGWTFTSSINMRRVIFCNHAQSIIISGCKEPFHILWIHPTLHAQWRQFKCKSWHSHHSASRCLLRHRRVGPDLNEARSAQLYILSVYWSAR